MRARGFSLIELMIGTAISALTIVVAVRFFTDHTRLLDSTLSTTRMNQDGRQSLDLLVFDLMHAGAGAGYRPDGSFAGLLRGSFSAPGGASFVSNDRLIDLEAGSIPSDDLGLRMAIGDARTIASYDGDSGQICAGGDYKLGEVILLLSQEGLHARSAKLSGLTSATCSLGDCISGCQAFTVEPDGAFVSAPSSANADYAGGELLGQFAQVVWWVTPGHHGQGALRRAELTDATPCPSRDDDCGGTIAEGVETLQVAVWQWDPLASAWVDRTNDPQIDGRNRLRVDVELVARSTQAAGGPPKSGVELSLAPGVCVPSPCNAPRSRVTRQVLRASVELKNSGRMLIR